MQLQVPPPALLDNDARTEMTVRCRDRDPIPKVDGAGSVTVIDGKRVQIMHNGVRVVADGYYGDWMTKLIERRKAIMSRIEIVFYEVMKHIPQQATMIELGGFWSYYSLWFLNQHRERSAFVVEPDPNQIAVGRQNAALNGAAIKFMQACVGRTSKPSVKFDAETTGTIDIPQISISDLMQRNNLTTLDLLHCGRTVRRRPE
jgi:hypothetical protein